MKPVRGGGKRTGRVIARHPVRANPSTLLDQAAARLGVSLRVLAEYYLCRDKRTVRRWRSGHSPLAPAVRRWLETVIATGKPPA